MGDEKRCTRCGWPIHERTEDGCTEANCSMRPMPPVRSSGTERHTCAMCWCHDAETIRESERKAERERIVAYLNRRVETRGLYASISALIEELERGEHEPKESK